MLQSPNTWAGHQLIALRLQPGQESLRKYLCSRTYQLKDRPHLYLVKTELNVFKTVYCDEFQSGIANLIIPAGALIRVANTQYLRGQKLRASGAIVHSIFDTNLRSRRRAVSGHDEEFIYKVGKTVTPENGFELQDKECAGGIHFFLDLYSAMSY